MLNKDKIYHLVAGYFIALIVGLYSVNVALLAVGLVAIGKEVYDYKNPLTNTSDGNDIIATVVGGMFAAMMYLN